MLSNDLMSVSELFMVYVINFLLSENLFSQANISLSAYVCLTIESPIMHRTFCLGLLVTSGGIAVFFVLIFAFNKRNLSIVSHCEVIFSQGKCSLLTVFTSFL